ncbi:MAG TPA: hypothetical protein VGY14_01850 [Methyloceanibacter sp.]|nr:hypothetical protein [Methyloceanibacter sp.]
MWRDLERVCEAEGLPLKLPPVKFPQNGLKAARIALVGARRLDTCVHTRFSLRTTPNRRTSAKTRSLRADMAIAAANGPENKDALRRQTEEAARAACSARHRVGQRPAGSSSRLGQGRLDGCREPLAGALLDARAFQLPAGGHDVAPSG